MCDESNEKMMITLWWFLMLKNFSCQIVIVWTIRTYANELRKMWSSTFSTITKKKWTSRPPTLLHITILPAHLFSKLHIRLMKYPSYCTNRKKKYEIVQQQQQNTTLPALPMFYNYYIVNVIIIILSAHKIFCT